MVKFVGIPTFITLIRKCVICLAKISTTPLEVYCRLLAESEGGRKWHRRAFVGIYDLKQNTAKITC